MNMKLIKYIYIHIHVHTHIRIHTHIHINLHVNIYIYLYIYISIRDNLCMYTIKILFEEQQILPGPITSFSRLAVV